MQTCLLRKSSQLLLCRVGSRLTRTHPCRAGTSEAPRSTRTRASTVPAATSTRACRDAARVKEPVHVDHVASRSAQPARYSPVRGTARGPAESGHKTRVQATTSSAEGAMIRPTRAHSRAAKCEGLSEKPAVKKTRGKASSPEVSKADVDGRGGGVASAVASADDASVQSISRSHLRIASPHLSGAKAGGLHVEAEEEKAKHKSKQARGGLQQESPTVVLDALETRNSTP